MKKLVTVLYKVYIGNNVYETKPRRLQKLLVNLVQDRQTLSTYGMDIKIVPIERYVETDKIDLSTVDAADLVRVDDVD